MNTETKVEIDTKEVATKLSFLVGKTVLFRNGYPNIDAATATRVIGVKAENTPGTEGVPQIIIYTEVGNKGITKSTEFNDIMLVDENGGLSSLGKITDNLGIVF